MIWLSLFSLTSFSLAQYIIITILLLILSIVVNLNICFIGLLNFYLYLLENVHWNLLHFLIKICSQIQLFYAISPIIFTYFLTINNFIYISMDVYYC
jgi:hypothetical protein